MNKEEKDFWNLFKMQTISDIDTCFKYRADVAVAKLICCAIDSLGSFYVGRGFSGKKYWIRPSVNSENLRFEKSMLRDTFIAFASKYIPKLKLVKIKLKNKKPIKKKSGTEFLYDNFRNGLIHGGLPSGGVEIARKRGKKILWKVPPQKILINLRPLKTSLKQAIKNYDKDLSQPERLRRWRDRYEYLKRFNLENFR